MELACEHAILPFSLVANSFFIKTEDMDDYNNLKNTPQPRFVRVFLTPVFVAHRCKRHIERGPQPVYNIKYESQGRVLSRLDYWGLNRIDL